MNGITITQPEPKRLADVRGCARALLQSADPPATFREALSVYRQMRAGGSTFFRCHCTVFGFKAVVIG